MFCNNCGKLMNDGIVCNFCGFDQEKLQFVNQTQFQRGTQMEQQDTANSAFQPAGPIGGPQPAPPQSSPSGNPKPVPPQAGPSGNAKPVPPQAASSGNAKPVPPQAGPGGNAKPVPPQAGPGGNAKPVPPQAGPGGNQKQAPQSNGAKPEHKKKSKKGMIIGIAAAILILLVGGGVGIYMLLSGPSPEEKQREQLLEYIDDREFTQAQEYYTENMSKKKSDKISEKISEEMSTRYETILSEYNQGNISNDDIQRLFSILYDLDISGDEYYSFSNQYSTLASSKQNYNSALDCISSEEYADAINYLSRVDSSDSNYSKVKEKTKSAIMGMIENSNNYADAFRILDNYSENFGKDEYNSIKQELTGEIESAVDKHVEELLNDNKFRDARDYLSDMVYAYPDIESLSGKLESLETNYITSVKEEAKGYFDAKEYGKAASTISAAQAQFDDENPELSELYKEYKSYTGMYIDEMVTLQNYGSVHGGRDVEDNTGKIYSHSFSFDKNVSYLLDGKYNTFTGTIALPMSNKNESDSYYYEIYGDETLIYTSPKFTAGSLPTDFAIDVTNVKVMKINIFYISRYGNEIYEGYEGELMIYDGLLNRNVE